MKASSHRTLVLAIVFLLGVGGGRLLPDNAPATSVSPLGIDRAEAKAGLQFQLIASRQPRHGTFRAALAESDTYKKILSLSAILSAADPLKFSKWWSLVQSDELARSLLLDTWMRRDLPGFSKWLTKQPRTRILEVLGLIKSSPATGDGFPAVLVRAMSNLSLDIYPEKEQNDFLWKLLQIDPALAKAAGKHASPQSARYIEGAIASSAIGGRIASDPRGVLGVLDDLDSEISLDQRRRAIEQLGRQDFAEAFRLAESAPAGMERSTLQAAVIGVWAQSEPADAIQWALGNLQGHFKNDALEGAIRNFDDHDGGQVELLQYVNDMPNRHLRKLLIGKVFDGWADWIYRDGEKHRDGVAAFVEAIRAVPLEDLPLNYGDIGFMWPNIDLVSSAAAVVEASPELDIDHFSYYVAQRFNRKEYGPDPVAGIEWAARLTPSRAKVAINTIIEGGYKEIASIAHAVAKLPEGELRSFAIPNAAEHWAAQNYEADAAWAREVGDEATAIKILEAGSKSALADDPFAE